MVWVTGDATLSTVGCANWNREEYLKWSTGDVLREFNGPSTAPPIIADVEFISSIAGVVVCGRPLIRAMELRDRLLWLEPTSVMCFLGAKRESPVGAARWNLGSVFDSEYQTRYRSHPLLPPNVSKFPG